MVDLERREIRLQGRIHPIVSFTVWWYYEGLGLFDTVEAAAKEMGDEKLNHLNIKAVPVALAEGGIYETL